VFSLGTSTYTPGYGTSSYGNYPSTSYSSNTPYQSGYSNYSSYSSEVCRDFRHGVCTRGEKCKFSHGTNPSALAMDRMGKPCRDFLKGKNNKQNQRINLTILRMLK
jgi:hypothetical protein